MSFCVDLVSEDSFYENITLGVTKLLGYLKKLLWRLFCRCAYKYLRFIRYPTRYNSPGFYQKCGEKLSFIGYRGGKKKNLNKTIETDPRICNVNVERRRPCDRMTISTWEQKHSAVLPEDLRNFYASSDGFHLTWSYKYSAEEILPVGSIHVNTLNELYLSPAMKDLLDFSLTRHTTEPRPTLNTKSKVFELDTCRTIGKVCLIYTGGLWSIWLATREGAWGWLADSFTQYFRMSLVHLGLPGWQATFANLPLIPWAEQLFLLLAPHLLERVETDSSNTSIAIENDTSLNEIDPNIFKTSVRHHKSTTRQTNQ